MTIPDFPGPWPGPLSNYLLLCAPCWTQTDHTAAVSYQKKRFLFRFRSF